MNVPTRPRYDYNVLLAFAFVAVASIALQNLLWVSVLLFLVKAFYDKQNLQWPRHSFALATVFFLLTYYLGALVGIDTAKSFQTVHKYLTFLVIFPLGAMVLSLTDLRKFFQFLIAGAAICALYGIIYKHFILHQDRLDSFSGDKMVFGGSLMVALILTTLFLRNNPRDLRYWSAFLLIGWALVFTETRGAWLGTLVGMILLAWRLDKRWILAGALLFAGAFFVMPQKYQDRLKSIVKIDIKLNKNMDDPTQNGKIDNASDPRFLIWAAGLNIIHDHPLGVGQGNIPEIYPKYRLANAYSEATVPHLHDNFLQLLAENGWLGLAAYLIWIFTFYWEALRFKTSQPEAALWNWGLLCAFTAVLVWGLTEYTFSHQFMNLQFALLGLQGGLWSRRQGQI